MVNKRFIELAKRQMNEDLPTKKTHKKENRQEQPPQEKRTELPFYLIEEDTFIERDKAIVRLGSYQSSGCSGTETCYTLEIKGRTVDGRGFSYKGEFSSLENREEDIKRKKKDLEKLVKDVVMDSGG